MPKIRVAFTLDIDPTKLDAIREHMGADETPGDLRDAFRREAAEYLVEYVNDNVGGVPVRLVQPT